MKRENIIILSENQLFILHPGVKISDLKPSYSWNKESLGAVLDKIFFANKFSHVGVLLNNKISYLFVFTNDNNKSDDGFMDVVKSKISEKIPFSMDEIVWDYKVVKFNNINYIQVAAVDKSILSIFEKFSEAHKIRLDFVEPIAYSLSRMNKDKKFSAILFTSGYESVLLLVAGSLVMFAENLSSQNFVTSIDSFISYVRSKYSLNFPLDLYLDDQMKLLRPTDLVSLKSSGFNIITRNLTEFVLAPPEDIKIRESKYRLNLLDKSDQMKKSSRFGWFRRHQAPTESDAPTIPAGPKTHTKLLLLILFIFLTGTIGFVYWYLDKSNLLPWSKRDPVLMNKTEKKQDQTPAVVVPQKTEPTPSKPQEIKRDLRLESFKGYKLQILNGTGIKGEADKVKEAILSLNFDEIATGNADNYEYEVTTVFFKSNDLKNWIELIEKSLKDYPLTFDEDLLEASSIYDVKIVVGSKRVTDELESEGITEE